jgi:hypothetical protein
MKGLIHDMVYFSKIAPTSRGLLPNEPAPKWVKGNYTYSIRYSSENAIADIERFGITMFSFEIK